MPGLQLKGVNLAPRSEGLDPIEIASRDEISALQLKRLKWTLAHAYNNVAHYKKSFDQAGVHPDDLKTLDDLRKFPFTAKDDLRRHYPFGMFAIPREQVMRVHASSGTTGKPTPVAYTQRDLETWAELMARALAAAGAHRGDIVHEAEDEHARRVQFHALEPLSPVDLVFGLRHGPPPLHQTECSQGRESFHGYLRAGFRLAQGPGPFRRFWRDANFGSRL